MSTLANYPATPLLFLNANNVDGVDNALVAHGADVSSWKAEGSAGLADFTPVGANDPTKLRANPYLKKNLNEQSVSFDGVYDQFVSLGSAGKLNPIHTTGVFDLYFVVRRRNSGSPRRIFGCSGGSAQQGLQIFQQIDDDIGPTYDGHVSATLASTTGLICSMNANLKLELGRPTLVLLRGEYGGGSGRLRMTRNFYTWENAIYTGALGVGDAYADYHLASVADAMATPNLFEGDQFFYALYDRNLALAEQMDLRAQVELEIGVGV